VGDAFIDTLELFPRGLVYVGLGIAVLALAKLVQDFLTPYRINEQLSHRDNTALALSITGYYFGIIATFVGAVYQPVVIALEEPYKFDSRFGWDVLEVFLYTLAGIAALNVARILVDKLVLYKFNMEKEIITDQNAGAGAVEFGVYVAVGLVIAAAIGGGGGGGVDNSVLNDALRSLAFLGLGLLALGGFAFFYQLTTEFDIHEQIEAGNVAVGVAMGGNLLAMGIVVFKAVFGEFINWETGLAGFITFAVAGFVLLFLVRVIVDKIILPGTKVADELAKDRNIGAAFIQSGVVISVALILNFAI
jgi:uncharacterized membrane protein YjfL (UPF0719 family)